MRGIRARIARVAVVVSSLFFAAPLSVVMAQTTPTPQQCGPCSGFQDLTLDAGPPQETVVGGNSLALNGSLKSSDGPIPFNFFGQASWSIVETALPPGLSIENTGNIRTTLNTPAVTSQLLIHIKLSLDTCSCADQIAVTIVPQSSVPTNHPPTAVASADKPSVRSGEKVTLDGSASSDPDQDNLVFNWAPDSGNAVAVTLSSETVDNSKVSFTAPEVGQTTVLTFNLSVSDSKGGSASAQVSVSVQTNHAPLIEKISGQTVGAEGVVAMSANAGSLVNLTAEASDPDQDPLSYHWTQLSGPTVELRNADQSNASFQAPAADSGALEFSFRLTVSDGSAEAVVTVQVTVAKNGTVLFPVAPLLTSNPLFSNIFVGVAIVNPNANPNGVEFSALDRAGNSTPVQPPNSTLKGLGQDAFLTSEVSSLPGDVATLLAQGRQGPIQGFFMLGDGSGPLKRLDGIGGELKEAKILYFPIARQDDSQATLLFLFNPQEPAGLDPGSATVTLKLMDGSGNLIQESSQVLSSKGTLSGTLDELFESGLQVPDGYIKVESDRKIKGFEFYATPENFASVNGQVDLEHPLDLVSGNVLSVPQFFVNGSGGDTEVRLLNIGDAEVFAKVEAFIQDGAESYQKVDSDTITIGAGQLFTGSVKVLLHLDTSGLLPGQFIDGYLKISVKGQGVGVFLKPAFVLGVVSFRLSDGKSLSTLPVIRNGSTDSVFLQVAQNDSLFTGLAILNSNGEDADVTVEVFDENGIQTGQFETTIPAGNRVVNLLTSFFGSKFQQVKGHVRVISSVPVMTFALFGDFQSEFLSAIEGQKPLN